jgi:hypothetical protein
MYITIQGQTTFSALRQQLKNHFKFKKSLMLSKAKFDDHKKISVTATHNEPAD